MNSPQVITVETTQEDEPTHPQPQLDANQMLYHQPPQTQPELNADRPPQRMAGRAPDDEEQKEGVVRHIIDSDVSGLDGQKQYVERPEDQEMLSQNSFDNEEYGSESDNDSKVPKVTKKVIRKKPRATVRLVYELHPSLLPNRLLKDKIHAK